MPILTESSTHEVKNVVIQTKSSTCFCQYGASTAILADATSSYWNRQYAEGDRGDAKYHHQLWYGEVHFKTKMTQLIMRGNTTVGCICR